MLLLYVDDIVVIGNSSEFIAEIVTGLGKEFAMNYLGPLHFFLCIKVRYFNGSIHLNQGKYDAESLNKTGMALAKVVSNTVGTKPLTIIGYMKSS